MGLLYSDAYFIIIIIEQYFSKKIFCSKKYPTFMIENIPRFLRYQNIV